MHVLMVLCVSIRTPGVFEQVCRFRELQKAAIFDEFDDKSKVTEQQSVCSLLILLFLNLIKTAKWF